MLWRQCILYLVLPSLHIDINVLKILIKAKVNFQARGTCVVVRQINPKEREIIWWQLTQPFNKASLYSLPDNVR